MPVRAPVHFGYETLDEEIFERFLAAIHDEVARVRYPRIGTQRA